MSCVARSLTTPTSCTRAGNGPLRTVEAVNSRPIWPPSSRRRSSWSAGLKRSTWPTAAWMPACVHVCTSASASSALAASGFSISSDTPAPASVAAISGCSSVGTETTAKSGAPALSSPSIEAYTSSGS